MSRKRKSRADHQPVTRRQVLRIVQAARDEILSAIVHTDWTVTGNNGTKVRHLADVESVEDR